MAKEPKDTAPETAPEKPRAFDAKRVYFAQRRILHGDQVLLKGAKIALKDDKNPQAISDESREVLWNAGDIAETAPEPTTVTTAK